MRFPGRLIYEKLPAEGRKMPKTQAPTGQHCRTQRTCPSAGFWSKQSRAEFAFTGNAGSAQSLASKRSMSMGEVTGNMSLSSGRGSHQWDRTTAAESIAAAAAIAQKPPAAPTSRWEFFRLRKTMGASRAHVCVFRVLPPTAARAGVSCVLPLLCSWHKMHPLTVKFKPGLRFQMARTSPGCRVHEGVRVCGQLYLQFFCLGKKSGYQRQYP